MKDRPLPAGMVQTQARVLANRPVAPDHFLMRLKSPRIAQRAKPGQFIHLQCIPQKGSGRPGTFFGGVSPLLRRPFSLLDLDAKAGTIDLIYKVVGLGTQTLSQIPAGRRLDLLGPLGSAFEIPREMKKAYLLGGGVGIPPLYLLAKRLLLEGRARPVAFLGARRKEWVICLKEFRRLGVPVHVATDDGTLGFRGSVVELARTVIAGRPERPTKQSQGEITSRFAGAHGRNDEFLYICGPTPMMAAAAAVAAQERLPAQVSLEERMGCAMGCCMGCVVEVTTEPRGAHMRFQRVCTEGPVFDAQAVVWRSNEG